MSRGLSLWFLAGIGVVAYVKLLLDENTRQYFEKIGPDFIEIIVAVVNAVMILVLFTILFVLVATYRIPVFLFSIVKWLLRKKKES